MPELPEVEVVRAGIAPAVDGARVVAVDVRDPRALKRHLESSHGVTLTADEGARRQVDFERRLTGATLAAPRRRGKFMWVPFAAGAAGEALLVHLGMSGQLLLRAHEAPDDRHVRARLWIEHPVHGELRIDFADQRLFGSLAIDGLVSDGPDLIPAQATHIARDPLDPHFDDARFVRLLGERRTPVKAALLDQTLLSGVGNIYADEALWRARVHPLTPGVALSTGKRELLLASLRDVFAQALAEGGTSFDAQYVNVNGQAGYFAHSLHAYGRTGEPCHRCGTPLKRIVLGGRATHFCPRCQRKPSEALRLRGDR